jgi:hypothetical protein
MSLIIHLTETIQTPPYSLHTSTRRPSPSSIHLRDGRLPNKDDHKCFDTGKLPSDRFATSEWTVYT